MRDEKWRREGFEPLVSAAGGAVCGIELWSVKRLNLSLWATCAGKLTVAETVAASCERHEREDWASGEACQSLRIYARAAQPGRMEVRKRMDRLLNFRRRCHASLLVLFASIPQNYLQLSSQDTALAAEVEQSTTPISESEHRSPCSDKRSTVEVPILVSAAGTGLSSGSTLVPRRSSGDPITYRSPSRATPLPKSGMRILWNVCALMLSKKELTRRRLPCERERFLRVRLLWVTGGCHREVDGTAGLPSAPEMPRAPRQLRLVPKH